MRRNCSFPPRAVQSRLGALPWWELALPRGVCQLCPSQPGLCESLQLLLCCRGSQGRAGMQIWSLAVPGMAQRELRGCSLLSSLRMIHNV